MINIKVVGGGCPNCNKLAQLCNEIAEESGKEIFIEKITDINKFAELGVLMTPGLIINGKLLASGMVPAKSVIRKWLENA